METELSKLKISDNHKNCSYCNKPFTEELWCKECDSFRIMEGWTSEYSVIDKFIKDTIFIDIKVIGFAKVYSATWIDGKLTYEYINGSWKKEEPESIKVALKRFYGLTKYPETKEFMMIMDFADKGSLKSSLSNNFNSTMWKNKIKCLFYILCDLNSLHKLGYCHKDFHSGNILQINDRYSVISDFGLSGPANEQKSDDKVVYGVTS
ncbi:kinase-like domain-containing protein [Rhizophagus irregularis DAOM 181602=DAOM 197198]|nr:kinase-like domain-containing protein [Rhizophagus irregularis DAOM 181602=DAOM 197198]